jgi:hypothetical protein
MMTTEFFTTARIAGILLLLSLLLILGGAGLIAAQGRLEGMAAAFRGVGFATGDASGLRIIARFAVPYLIAQLAGFALLTLLLLKTGNRGAAVVALSFFVVATMISVIEVSFHASVTVWAAGAARAGSVPEFYEPLRRWLNYDVQRISISFQLTALLLFSWSALRARVLPAWLGWAALAWSLLSFWLYFSVTGAPAVAILTPLLIGVGLVWRG